ncbi:MAG: ribonuclease HI [Treponemataceae bacterium]
MKKYCWAVISTGKMATTFTQALSILKNNGELELQAVASRSLERAENFAKQFGFNCYYDSYEQAFTDPAVDIVYIATPHNTHASLSIKALKSGKHVVCEKPATVNAHELENVLAVAKEENHFFLEALWMRFNPAVHKAFEILRSGKIGSLYSIFAHFHIFSPADPKHRRYTASTAGGSLLDIGIYPVSFALACAAGGLKLKEPSTIQSLARFYDEQKTDRETLVNLLFEARDKSIISANLSCSFDAEHETLKEAWICGSHGKIRLPLFWMAQEIEIYDTHNNLLEVYKLPFEINGYEYEIRNTMECIEKSLLESTIHPHNDSLLVAKTLDAIRKQIGLVYTNDELSSSSCLGEQQNNAINKSELVVYTDGGCAGNPGPGGWGYLIMDESVQSKTEASGGERETTNNRMELFAVISALEAITQNERWQKREITFFVDSQYVKDGITSWIHTWKINGWKTAAKQPVKNQDLWIELDELTHNLSIKWQWIKGHSGNKHNDYVDSLCQEEIKKF